MQLCLFEVHLVISRSRLKKWLPSRYSTCADSQRSNRAITASITLSTLIAVVARRSALRDVTNDDRRLEAEAARRDESVEIVAAVAQPHSMCARLQPAERNGSNAFCGSTIPKKTFAA